MKLSIAQARLVIYITVALLIVFCGLWFSGKRQIKTLAETIGSEKLIQLTLEDSIQGLNIRTKADQFFILGNYDSAAYYYKQYQKYDPELGDLFRQRMDLIENSEQSDLQRDLSRQELEYKIAFLEKTIHESSFQIAQLDSMITNQNASLALARKEKAALNDSIIVLRAAAKTSPEKTSDTLVFVVSSGNKVRYYGQVSNNRANGVGSGFWSTGGYYHGEWKNNQRHGEGFYIWKEGHKYKGTFVNDIRDGYGIYRWPDGEYYEGDWKDNKRNGKGTLYNSDGFIKYSGAWLDDKPVNGSN
ncbi:MAG: hypothetical protein ACK4K0_12295 [Flavobacteriales bacterium]